MSVLDPSVLSSQVPVPPWRVDAGQGSAPFAVAAFFAAAAAYLAVALVLFPGASSSSAAATGRKPVRLPTAVRLQTAVRLGQTVWSAMLSVWCAVSSAVPSGGGSPDLPHLPSAIPFVGHALSLQANGGHHVRQLLLDAPWPLFSINILWKRLIVVHPSLDRVLARHVDDTSLVQSITLVGARALELSPKALQIFAEYDPRPTHAHAISSPQEYAAGHEAATACLRRHFARQPAAQEVWLGRWLFDAVVDAVAHAAWGPANPWSMDRGFMDRFMQVVQRRQGVRVRPC